MVHSLLAPLIQQFTGLPLRRFVTPELLQVQLLHVSLHTWRELQTHRAASMRSHFLPLVRHIRFQVMVMRARLATVPVSRSLARTPLGQQYRVEFSSAIILMLLPEPGLGHLLPSPPLLAP